MSTNVKLSSSDDQEFTVEKAVAEMSVTIKNMLEGTVITRLTTSTSSLRFRSTFIELESLLISSTLITTLIMTLIIFL